MRRRNAGEQPRVGSGVFACRDGYVFLMSAGVGANRFWHNTLRWLEAEGADTRRLSGPDWEQDAFLASDHAKQAFRDVFATVASTRTKDELFVAVQRILFGVVLIVVMAFVPGGLVEVGRRVGELWNARRPSRGAAA